MSVLLKWTMSDLGGHLGSVHELERDIESIVFHHHLSHFQREGEQASATCTSSVDECIRRPNSD